MSCCKTMCQFLHNSPPNLYTVLLLEKYLLYNVTITGELCLKCIFEENTVCDIYIIVVFLSKFEPPFLRYNVFGDDQYQNING